MSNQRLSRQYTKLECPECRAPVASNNFKRHWARHHQVNPGARTLESGLGESPDMQQGRSSADLTIEDPNLGNRMSITPSVSSSSIVTAATATAQYSMAARALLKRTNHYTEAGLMAFLEDKYPEIPANHRHSLIVGALTGAQTAAQLYVLLDGAKSGKVRGSRETAEGARRMLSFCNLGLMSEDPSDPHPQIRLSPKPSVSSRCQIPLPMELPEARGESEEPVIPAPVKEVGHQEEPLASEEEEGDDTQSTTRAIELVELEIPGTQPCNRPGTSGREERGALLLPPMLTTPHWHVSARTTCQSARGFASKSNMIPWMKLGPSLQGTPIQIRRECHLARHLKGSVGPSCRYY